MMDEMNPTVLGGARRAVQRILFCFSVALVCNPTFAQVSYSVRVEMEKPKYLLGEPIFCRFVIQNTGTTVFAFRYRTPTRGLGADDEQEPRFQVRDEKGQRLSDPGPRPCGSPQGTAVYGSVTLPPGQIHSERWLLNQWAQFTAPGRYHVRAERRLALLQADPQTKKFAEKPAAFAMAIDELSFQVVHSTPAQIEEVFHPYLAAVQDPKNPNPAEAVVVLTSMPQPFFLDQLIKLASAGKSDHWDRRDFLDGLARMNTPASWQAILKMFREAEPTSGAAGKGASAQTEDPLRSYALLLLAEKAEPGFVPVFMEMLGKSPDPLRGDILRALGFFHDAQAVQALFDNLHSAQVTDRMNAILGLKNLGTKEVIPAMVAALNDPEQQVRQVANFALEGLTGYKVPTSANPSRDEPARIASDWHAWWVEHAASFSPPAPAACHDW